VFYYKNKGFPKVLYMLPCNVIR